MVEISAEEMERRLREAREDAAAGERARIAAEREERDGAIARAAAAAALQAQQKEKDKSAADTDKLKHMSFAHDPTKAEQAVFPWAGASIRVPKDLVALIRARTRPPLVWLSVEGLLDFASPRRRLLVVPVEKDKETKKLLELGWDMDAYITRGAFSQAIQALASVLAVVSPATAANPAGSAGVFEDLHLTIVGRATDEHWPVWRRYALLAMEWLWEEREDGQGVGIDTSQVNQELLRRAERDCGQVTGFVDTFTGTRSSMLARLLRAETRTKMEEIGSHMDYLHHYATFGGRSSAPALIRAPQLSPMSPSAPAPKRMVAPTSPSKPANIPAKRPSSPSPPFRAAPPPGPSYGGGAPFNPPRGPRAERRRAPTSPWLCPSCVTECLHEARDCTNPRLGHDRMELTARGWRRKTEPLPYCVKFNIGINCAGNCGYGHYCSACPDNARPGCKAIRHFYTSN
ncbi:hypothetical protein V8E36_003457 [Tilletia maclaganii]